MIVEETINGKVFIAQTTYYVYASEEARQNGIATLTTSNTEVFETNKKATREGETKTIILI
jgi:hypothetical protein